ncbi:hypothetical protein SLS62_004227 [Diatrype stigma]|uniref:Transmembrane and coiled-coil domain-containing protein 4 n=1 Tax=Diatrype stigma TaxID=117547 RepID=A0AAN9YQS0_9PEZI
MSLSSSPGSSADEGSETMGRNSGRNAPPRRVELDMSAIMSMDQKNSLQNLVTSITDEMQNNLRNSFETLSAAHDPFETGINTPMPVYSMIPNPRSAKYQHLYGSKDNGTETDQGTQLVPPAPILPPGQPLLTIPKSVEEASQFSGKSVDDILSSSVAELKKEVLAYFGKWRANVLRRIGDMIIKGGGTGGIPAGQGPQQAPGAAKRPHKFLPTKAATKSSGPDPITVASNEALVDLYPAMPSNLSNLPKEKRAIILHSVMLLLLGLEHYSAYSRCLLLHLANSLKVPAHVLGQDEARVAGGLSQIVKGVTAEEITQRRAEEAKSSRRWRAGLNSANTTGNGNTATLAAPLVAAGIGSVFGGFFGLGPATTAALLGNTAESIVTVGSLFGLYGGRPGGKTMESFAKEIQDFALLPLHGSTKAEVFDPKDVPSEDRGLRVVIGINGWLTEESESVTAPWKFLGSQNEVYALRLEVEAMEKMGSSLQTVVKSAAWTSAKKEIASREGNEYPSIPSDQQLKGFPVFASLNQAVWPGGLLKVSKIAENPWCVGMVRAEKAGLVLAEALINKVQGERGVTLIGYSLGARVIYACLMALAEKRAFGLVENAVIIGGPCPSETRVWAAMSSAVAGRLVNVYSKSDYLLGFLYRSSSWHYGVAGLQKVQGVAGIENLDVSGIVKSHDDYRYLTGTILKQLSWEDISHTHIAKDEAALAQLVAQRDKLEQERHEASELATQTAQMHRVSLNQNVPARKVEEPQKNKENRRPTGRKTGRGRSNK